MGKAFESIKQSLTEALGHAKGTQSGVKVWRPSAAGDSMMNTIAAKDRFDEPVTEDVLRRATKRGQQRRALALHASAVTYVADSQMLDVRFADESAVVLPIKNYPELAQLSPTELASLTLGYAGSAQCLDDRDLHISIAGLVSASAPLMAMASVVVASRNGSRRSESKSIAARQNGQKGGRPRKTSAPD